jgi:hypothetical protein
MVFIEEKSAANFSIVLFKLLLHFCEIIENASLVLNKLSWDNWSVYKTQEN